MPEDYGSLISSAGSMIPGPWGSAAQVAGGLVTGITGLIQKHKAKKLLGDLRFPNEAIPQEVLQNQQMAQARAQTGLPSQQYQQGVQNIQRQQLQAIRGATDRRAGMGLVGATQQQSNDALLGLNVADAKQRIANEGQLMNVNNQVGNWRDKIWQNNVKGKYDRDRAYAMSLMGAGNQNLVGGIDKVASGGLTASGLFGGMGGNQKPGKPPVYNGNQRAPYGFEY